EVGNSRTLNPTNAVGGTTTKWLRPKAQGCCTQLPWEKRRRSSQPRRGCGKAPRRRPSSRSVVCKLGRNPVGVAEHARRLSQGSRVQQPWEGGRIPFGENVQTPAQP